MINIFIKCYYLSFYFIFLIFLTIGVQNILFELIKKDKFGINFKFNQNYLDFNTLDKSMKSEIVSVEN